MTFARVPPPVDLPEGLALEVRRAPNGSVALKMPHPTPGELDDRGRCDWIAFRWIPNDDGGAWLTSSLHTDQEVQDWPRLVPET